MIERSSFHNFRHGDKIMWQVMRKELLASRRACGARQAFPRRRSVWQQAFRHCPCPFPHRGAPRPASPEAHTGALPALPATPACPRARKGALRASYAVWRASPVLPALRLWRAARASLAGAKRGGRGCFTRSGPVVVQGTGAAPARVPPREASRAEKRTVYNVWTTWPIGHFVVIFQ